MKELYVLKKRAKEGFHYCWFVEKKPERLSKAVGEFVKWPIIHYI